MAGQAYLLFDREMMASSLLELMPPGIVPLKSFRSKNSSYRRKFSDTSGMGPEKRFPCRSQKRIL